MYYILTVSPEDLTKREVTYMKYFILTVSILFTFLFAGCSQVDDVLESSGENSSYQGDGEGVTYTVENGKHVKIGDTVDVTIANTNWDCEMQVKMFELGEDNRGPTLTEETFPDAEGYVHYFTVGKHGRYTITIPKDHTYSYHFYYETVPCSYVVKGNEQKICNDTVWSINQDGFVYSYEDFRF